MLFIENFLNGKIGPGSFERKRILPERADVDSWGLKI
jgi:hypothetical protein